MNEDPKRVPDKNYLKICIYASVTVVVTVVALYLIACTGSFWARIWALFTAILRPLLIGLILCYLLSPIVSVFERWINHKKKRRGSRILSILFAYLLAAAIVSALVTLVLVTAYKNISSLNYDIIIHAIADAVTAMELNFNDLPAKLQELLSIAGITVGGVGSMATGAVNAVVTGVERFTTGMFFGIIFSVYFLLDGSRIGDYWQHVFRTVFGEAAGNMLGMVLDDFNRVFSGYLRGQMLDATIVMVISCIALTLIGVPNSILVGVLIGLGNLIPYVGPIVGYIVLALVCLPGGAFTQMIVGFICVAVMMFIDANIINPKLLSENVEVHPLLVVAALIGGGALGGLLGMLIAVPVAAFLKVQLDRFVSRIAAEKEKENAERTDGHPQQTEASETPAAGSTTKRKAGNGKKNQAAKKAGD